MSISERLMGWNDVGLFDPSEGPQKAKPLIFQSDCSGLAEISRMNAFAMSWQGLTNLGIHKNRIWSKVSMD